MADEAQSTITSIDLVIVRMVFPSGSAKLRCGQENSSFPSESHAATQCSPAFQPRLRG
jgi:hypothetical protein